MSFNKLNNNDKTVNTQPLIILAPSITYFDAVPLQ